MRILGICYVYPVQWRAGSLVHLQRRLVGFVSHKSPTSAPESKFARIVKQLIYWARAIREDKCLPGAVGQMRGRLLQPKRAAPTPRNAQNQPNEQNERWPPPPPGQVEPSSLPVISLWNINFDRVPTNVRKHPPAADRDIPRQLGSKNPVTMSRENLDWGHQL